MPRVRKQNHTHKLFKPGGKYTSLWKCALPDCRFFVYQAQENVLFGRKSLCWECGDEFIMEESTMKDEMPKCLECLDKIERGITPIPLPIHADTAPDDAASKLTREELKEQLKKRIKIYKKDLGMDTTELEEQLKKM